MNKHIESPIGTAAKVLQNYDKPGFRYGDIVYKIAPSKAGYSPLWSKYRYALPLHLNKGGTCWHIHENHLRIISQPCNYEIC